MATILKNIQSRHFDFVTNTLYCRYSDYWVHPYCGWFDCGELEDPVARQCRLPMEKVVAGRRNGLAVLARSRTVVHGTRDVNTLGSSSCALALGDELLGA